MSKLKFKTLGINILVSLVSILFSALFLILVLEVRHYIKNKQVINQTWHDPNTQFDPELGWSPIPNRSINSPDWGMISSNSLGFRSAEIDQNKNQIIVLGDSIAWGFGVNDEETFPHYLDKLVSSMGYQVSNLAVSGYGIDQYYLFFKRHISRFNNLKKVILVIYPDNDFISTGSNFCYGKRKPLFKIKNSDLILTNTKINKYCLRNLFSNSYFLSRYLPYEGTIGKFLSLVAGDKVLTEGEAKEISLLLFQKIYDLVISHKTEFLVVLSPAKNDFTERSDSLKWFEHVFNKVKGKGINYIDYIEALKNNQKELDNIYLDNGHYTKKGNLLLAETVYKYLQEETKLAVN